MKKILMMMVAGWMVMAGANVFAGGAKVSDEVLAGAEQASPLNWRSSKLVWKTGTIDNKTDQGVVIGDTAFLWSGYGTKFRDADGSTLAASNFGAGTEVTYILDKDRKTIVTLIRGTAEESEE